MYLRVIQTMTQNCSQMYYLCCNVTSTGATDTIAMFLLLTGGVKTEAPIPVAGRSRVSVCGNSLAGIAGSNPAGLIDVYFL